MKRMVLFFLWMTISTLTVTAQTNIKGKVTDAETGEALYGANVIIENTNIGTTTNDYGLFQFDNVDSKSINLIVTYIGYGSVSKSINDNKKNVDIVFQLYKKEISTDQIFITASKHEQTIDEVPGRVELISKRMIKSTSARNIDDMFKTVAGVHVDRSFGIFDHKAVVNIRGVTSNQQGRVLALLDGMPINKSDGGSVNWNRINIADIERIEIFKGPGSSIYGTSAMGGVINLISKKDPPKEFEINGAVRYGTYNTYEENVGISGRIEGVEGLYYRAGLFNRKSDGYVKVREEFIDDYTIKSNLQELGVNVKLGYNFSDNTGIQFNYNFYDDIRGGGTKVEKENNITHKTNYASMTFNTLISDIELSAGAYLQAENYLRVSEKYKIRNGALSSYSRYHVDADRTDMGLNFNTVIPIADHSIVTGVEFKLGSIDGSDVYQTSTDVVTNKGDMYFLSAFVQDEFKLAESFKLLAGLRMDNVQFKNGEFLLSNPTSATNFMDSFEGELEEYNWTSLTPKISLQYRPLENLSMYAAYSRGFRAASLDDLTRSGFVSGGFKNANPELQPEKIDNFEFGLNFDLDKSLFVLPSFYFMKGTDFMSYIGTGETIFGGRRKVMKKDNITEVDIFGGDIALKYFMTSNMYMSANYTYINTEILSYEGSEELVGKELIYSPNHLANFGISYLNPFINASLNLNYQSEQFISEDNIRVDDDGYSQVIEECFTINLKIWKNIGNRLELTIDIQDLLNRQGLSAYDSITPGRMVMVGLSYGL